MERKILMEDIAGLAGVSKATVSRALRAPDLVRPETREKILEMMRSCGYVYDAVAGDLSRKKTSVIGLIIPTIQSSIFARSSHGIQERAREAGFSVTIGNSGYSAESESEYLRLFQQRRVAGIIITGLSGRIEHLVREISEAGTPCVVIWDTPAEDGLHHVGFNNFRAGHFMTRYLLGLGHRRIGLITGPVSRIERARERVEGYRAALAESGVPDDPELVVEKSYTPLEGKEAALRLLSLPDPPTAIFAVSDVLALGALAAVKERGQRVPEDVSVAGFDDIDFAAYLDPPLTTVRVPASAMGELAVQTLLEAIRGGAGNGPRRYSLDTDLIIRGSTREAKRT